jgi:predicted XRE-type DNA-binding protein
MSNDAILPSSGNVFADLGFDPKEAAHLELRSSLMIAIRQLIEDRNLTQTSAAKLLGVSQPRVSDLVRGRIDLFSIDALVDMLARAGVKLTVSLSPSHERGAA